MGRNSKQRLVISLSLAGVLMTAVLIFLLTSQGVGPASADGGGASPTPLPTHTITLLPTLTYTVLPYPYPYPASLPQDNLAASADNQPPQTSTGFACWPLAILLIVVVIIFSSWRMGGARR